MAKSMACVAETALERRPPVREAGCVSYSPVAIPFQAIKLATYAQ